MIVAKALRTSSGSLVITSATRERSLVGERANVLGCDPPVPDRGDHDVPPLSRSSTAQQSTVGAGRTAGMPSL